MSIRTSLQGKKTYIAALLFALVVFLEQIGVLTPEQADMAEKFIGSFGVIALGAKIKRLLDGRQVKK